MDLEDEELEEIETVRLAPELLRAVHSAPWKVATLHEGFPPLPIKKAGCSFAGGSDWLALSGHDWTIVRLEDVATGETVPVTPDAELREGLRVIFLCSETATLKGYASYEEAECRSRHILDNLKVGDILQEDIRICRTDHVQKSGRVAIAGDNRYTLLKGAKLTMRTGATCAFEYSPMQRLQRNFGEVRSRSNLGPTACLDVLRFRDEAVTPGKRLGLKKGRSSGLDLRAAHGVSVLGVARQKSTEWHITWNPPPDFAVLPGDHCVALPLPDKVRASTSALFEGRARVSWASTLLANRSVTDSFELDCELTPVGAPGVVRNSLSFSPRLGPALNRTCRPPPFLVKSFSSQ